MLTTIREKTQGIIAAFIIVVIAIVMALFGLDSFLNTGQTLSVANVNGTEISERQYQEHLDNWTRGLDAQATRSPELKKQAFDNLVEQVLKSQDARERGFRIGDEALAQLVSGFEMLLRQDRRMALALEEQQRTYAMNAQVQVGLVYSGIVTQAEAISVLRLQNQQRQIAYAIVPAARFRSAGTLEPEAVERYYGDHPDEFRTVEQVRIEYLRLTADSVARDVQPTEDDLREAYESEPARIVRRETRRAAHILITLAADAPEDEREQAATRIRDIENQLRAGGDFAALARTHSQDTDSASKGGDLGEIGADTQQSLLPLALVDAVYALQVGGISAPIRTEYGYHLVKLSSISPQVLRPYAELKPQLIRNFRQRAAEEAFFDANEKLREIVYAQSDSLVPAAEALGLKLETSDWFDRSGGSGIAAEPRVIEAAFDPDVLAHRRNSDVIELPGNVLAAVRLAEHRPSVVRPLAEVRSQIEHKLRQQAAQQAARVLGEKLVAELAGGKAVEVLARQHGLTLVGPRRVTRRQAPGFDSEVVAAAFRASRPPEGGASAGGVELGNGDYAAFAVTEVVEGDPSKADATVVADARRLLTQRRGEDYYRAYLSRLRKTADVEVYKSELRDEKTAAP